MCTVGHLSIIRKRERGDQRTGGLTRFQLQGVAECTEIFYNLSIDKVQLAGVTAGHNR